MLSSKKLYLTLTVDPTVGGVDTLPMKQNTLAGILLFVQILGASVCWAEPARTELRVTIGHTSRETLAFSVAGNQRVVAITSGSATRTSSIQRKTYQSWLIRFRELKARGLALKDHPPLCGHLVTFRESGRPGVDVCYDRDLNLDLKIAKLWREVRAQVTR